MDIRRIPVIYTGRHVQVVLFDRRSVSVGPSGNRRRRNRRRSSERVIH